MRRWRPVAATLLFLAVAAAVLLRIAPHLPLSSYSPSSVAIYADDGRLLRLTLAVDDQYRLWTNLDAISPEVVEALLVHEDQYFYYHPGINPVALARATGSALAGSPRSGASTITMQLARRLYGLRTRSISGKLEQIIAALWLSVRYSKREILEAHLNLLPFGGNVQGIGAASLIYFGKTAANLSLAEAIALVVIPQAPRARDPSAGEPEGLRRARQRLLHRWALLHPTDTAALTLARSPLHFGSPRQLPFLAPHLTDWLVRNATGRGDIRTTVNIPLQRLLEQSVRRYVAANQTVGIRNASAMLVDTRNMEVKALVGSADHGSADIDGAVNGAFAKRSPGSALKPFIYALAMDESLIHPLTVLKDAPTAFGPYSPENFDGAFVGPITATDALIGSRNVPAVALASRLSQPSFYQFLKSAEISRLASERHYGLTLALGGGEVTMEELARLYAMLANGGSLRPLRYAQHAASDAEVRLLSPEASFMVLDMLAQNPRPDGAGNDGAAWMPIAWKTGTSWGFRDAWSAGIVGSYVLVVWVGNFDGRGNPAFVGIRAAAPLFFTIGDALATSYPSPPAVGFRPPAGVRRVEVCSASGDLPNADCPRRALTWFIPGRSPVHLSTVHRRLKLDIRTGRQACPSAPDWAIREEVYEFWPSDLRALFAKAGMPRRRPPESGDCGTPEFSVAARPSIASPLSGAVYQIRAQRLGADALNLVASGDGAIRRLYWFVDSSFVGQSEPSAPLAWIPPRAGEFEISVVDDQGASDSRTVRVGLIP